MEIITLIENREVGTPGLTAEHGLSMLIKHDGQTILFDTGASGAFADNAETLGIDLAVVDLAVISHHHFDHAGGLARFLSINDHAPVYLRDAPERSYRFRALRVIQREIGPDWDALKQYHNRLVSVYGNTEIRPGIWLITDITQEHPLPAGNRSLYAVKRGKTVRDDFSHELMMVALEEDGQVVFTGCAHHGVINMDHTAGDQFPGIPIKSLLGGFHLVNRRISKTMADSPEVVASIGRYLCESVSGNVHTGHCTGEDAYRALEQVMGEQLSHLAMGVPIQV